MHKALRKKAKEDDSAGSGEERPKEARVITKSKSVRLMVKKARKDAVESRRTWE